MLSAIPLMSDYFRNSFVMTAWEKNVFLVCILINVTDITLYLVLLVEHPPVSNWSIKAPYLSEWQ